MPSYWTNLKPNSFDDSCQVRGQLRELPASIRILQRRCCPLLHSEPHALLASIRKRKCPLLPGLRITTCTAFLPPPSPWVSSHSHVGVCCRQPMVGSAGKRIGIVCCRQPMVGSVGEQIGQLIYMCFVRTQELVYRPLVTCAYALSLLTFVLRSVMSCSQRHQLFYEAPAPRKLLFSF